MKAVVFSLPNQAELVRTIRSALRMELYDDIQIDHHVLDAHRIGDTAGKLYLELLRAATISLDDYSVQAQDGRGNWLYFGGYDASRHFLRVSQTSYQGMFPAVAVMNRMVLIPESLVDALDQPSDFKFLFVPLELQGVTLVDFADPESIFWAVRRVGIATRQNVRALAERQMIMRRYTVPDFDELSALLGISDTTYVSDAYHAHHNVLTDFRASVTPMDVHGGTENLIEIVLECMSPDFVGTLWTSIRGPRRTVASESSIQYIDFDRKNLIQVLTVRIEVPKVPFLPLELCFRVHGQDSETGSISIPLVIDVSCDHSAPYPPSN